jgi:hypothetical protein
MDKQQAIEAHRQAAEALSDIGTTIVHHMQTIRECDRIRDDHELTTFHIYKLYNYAKSLHDCILEIYQITEEQLQEYVAKEERFQRIFELMDLPYKEYLQTPEWQERRLRIIERDGHRCQVCNSPDRLNVHHRDYTRRGYENDADLTTLCQKCHQVFHENSRLVRVKA